MWYKKRVIRHLTRHLSFGRFLFLLSVLSLVAAGLLVWTAHQFFQSEFPDMTVMRNHYPVIRPRGLELPPRVTFQKEKPPTWVSLDQISERAVEAVVVSEDWAFFQHKGYDPNQIKEAFKSDLARGHFARGASTITQQVVRNVFLDKDKNLWRKLKEIYLAVRLEQAVGKRKILETYLNIAEWGDGIYGISAASQYYFRKAPRDLDAKEGAFLAMLLPSPKRYAKSFRVHQLTDYARSTVDSILDKMVHARYLSEQERETIGAIPLSFEAPSPGAM